MGAPFETVTLLHYAECLARVPNKRVIRYRVPLLIDNERRWVDVEELDTSNGIVPYSGEDYFSVIVRGYLASGRGRSGRVGGADCHLLDAASLTEFGVAWMEQNLGGK